MMEEVEVTQSYLDWPMTMILPIDIKRALPFFYVFNVYKTYFNIFYSWGQRF